jgi:hypothetical protein
VESMLVGLPGNWIAMRDDESSGLCLAESCEMCQFSTLARTLRMHPSCRDAAILDVEISIEMRRK